MELNIDHLRRQLAALLDRDVTWREIARGAGVSEFVMYRIANNTVAAANFKHLEAIRQYFIAQGLDVAPGDMFREKPPAAS